jgi:hypothetical protein
MVGNQDNRSVRVGILNILDAENIHQIVRREEYPKRSDMPLAKRPESLPEAEIHSSDQLESRSLDWTKHTDLFRRWH